MNPERTDMPLTERKVVRRGMLAGLAALGAAAMVKLTGADQVQAASTAVMTEQTSLTAISETRLTASPAFDGFALRVINGGGVASVSGRTGIMGAVATGIGVYGHSNSSGIGVFGNSSTGAGVRGYSNGAASTRGGVEGEAGTLGVLGLSPINNTGVKGLSNDSTGGNGDGAGIGVHGRAASGQGVFGETTTGQGVRGYSNSAVANSDGAGSGIGVHGKSGSGVGVKGESTSAPGTEGISVNSLGVRGTSTNFVGVVGISTNNHGLYGFSGSASGSALVGDNGGGGLAGVFNGRVEVYGSFQVFGVKNAVLKMPDGTNALVYCQESPEPYFEDFGRAQLVGGVANVPIERDFAALVAGGDYMVFTHPEGDTRGLFVSRRGPAGFEVREVQGGTGNVPFTYRIVTKRKDVEGKRFARVGDEGARSVAVARASLGLSSPPVIPGPAPLPPVSPVAPPSPLTPADGARGPR
jgi:hypothetical protein